MIRGYRNYHITKRLSVVIFLTTILILSACACGTTQQTAIFTDANLEAAIREAIGKPEGPISTPDLESLTVLDASGKGINDISVLAGLTNLQKLYLWDNNISDISPLAGLSKLQELYLWGNNISDISALAIFNLQKLYLWDNNISDISPLAGLTNLQELRLRDNNISDISALASLINLRELYLGGNNISDISASAGLSRLRELYLGGNNISDISSLVENSGLSDGDTVNLSGNPLSLTSMDDYIPQLEARGVRVVASM